MKRAGLANRLIIVAQGTKNAAGFPEFPLTAGKKLRVGAHSSQKRVLFQLLNKLAGNSGRAIDSGTKEDVAVLSSRRLIPREYHSIRLDFDAKMAKPRVYSSAWRSAAALAHGHNGNAAKVKAPRISR